MMTEDDDAARKSRAENLRKQIDSLKHERSGAEAEHDADISPRDFIHKKMNEPAEDQK
jgi:hypothetical protein